MATNTATNTSQINVSELDFDLIKNNLIEYFSTDPTFTDYQFEGSALNILIDILAYNTHLNSVIANMSANEMFLDSAQLRQSILSIAKTYGYTPRSVTTARANISLDFPNVVNFPQYLVVPEGTRFSTNQGYIFSTNKQHLVYRNSETGTYKIDDVEILEGFYTDYQYTVDGADPDQKFIIPSKMADTKSVKVTVTENNTRNNYSLNQNITLLTPESQVFFLQENPDGFFEVTFGDNILGRKPINGATININCIISSGAEEANGISTFVKYQQIAEYSDYTVSTVQSSYGGDGKETKEVIQKLTPSYHKAQNRAVVKEDYETFILQNYSFIEEIKAWGGENNDPPIYGKIFLSLKPKNTIRLTKKIKDNIVNDLINKYNVVTVIPEIVDPDYIYILVDTDVEYDKTKTYKSDDDIKIAVNDKIHQYFNNITSLFSANVYHSKILNNITSADVSIVNAVLDLQLMKQTFPTQAVPFPIGIKFNNEIKPGTVYTTFYDVNELQVRKIEDDSNGSLLIKNAITDEIITKNIGSVDYTIGKIDFEFIVNSLPTTKDVKIYATPVYRNIKSGFNQIPVLDNSPLVLDTGQNEGVFINVTQQQAK